MSSRTKTKTNVQFKKPHTTQVEKRKKTKPVSSRPKNVPRHAMAVATVPTRPRATMLVAPTKSAPVSFNSSERSARAMTIAHAGNSVARIARIKNLKSESPTTKEERSQKPERMIARLMDPKACLSPDAQRYTELLEDPLNAPWGDADEKPVRPLLYTESEPPSLTATVRMVGQTEFFIKAGSVGWVAMSGGPSNQDTAAELDNDDTPYAHWNVFPVQNGTWTLGAPNDGRGNTGAVGAESGRGCAGYIYSCTDANAAPWVNTATAPPTGTNGPAPFPLAWGTPAPYGGMKSNDASAYKYRAVAAGLLITPLDATLSVGGAFDAMIIPHSSNNDFVSAGAGYPAFTAATSAEVLNLPDHCITRGDDAISVAWLPSRQDFNFFKTSLHKPGSAADATSSVAANMRCFVRITPPADGNDHRYMLDYAGFYEIAGRCIQSGGSIPRPQPSLAAKISTAVQTALVVKLEDQGGRDHQISEGTTLEVLKDHPQVGPMVEKADTMPKAKSMLQEILSFGKELIPLAGLLL